MTEQQTRSAGADRLYRHDKRPAWGMAILAWDHGDRRGYQFEDGKLRVLARRFCDLMSEVDRPVDEAADTIAALNRLLAINDKKAAVARDKTTQRGSVDPLALADQISAFAETFHAGFADPKWKADMRGKDQSRRVKKHRDVAIEDAQRLMALDRLEMAISGQQFGSVVTDYLTVLNGTDLVAPSQVAPVKRLEPAHHQALATGVRDLLYGTGAYSERFGVFVDKLTTMLGKSPSWQLATALGALVFPTAEICVSPSAFREQSRWMAPQLSLPNVPQAAAYDRIAAMVRGVRDGLEAEGVHPVDMLDVHDFIRFTLSPSVRKRADAFRAERLHKQSREDAAA